MGKRLIFLLAFLVCGCVTIKTVPPEQRQRIYSQEYKIVWNDVVEMLTQENFPIKSMDKENGLIQTDYNKKYMKDSWMAYARYSLGVFISPIDKNRTKIIINPHYEAYLPGDLFPTAYGAKLESGQWVTKDSKDGLLINKYFRLLEAKLLK